MSKKKREIQQVVRAQEITPIVVWPEDQAAQRAWALAHAIACKPFVIQQEGSDKPESQVYLDMAEDFLGYINGSEEAKVLHPVFGDEQAEDAAGNDA